jgi:hypothetical protein
MGIYDNDILRDVLGRIPGRTHNDYFTSACRPISYPTDLLQFTIITIILFYLYEELISQQQILSAFNLSDIT